MTLDQAATAAKAGKTVYLPTALLRSLLPSGQSARLWADRHGLMLHSVKGAVKVKAK